MNINKLINLKHIIPALLLIVFTNGCNDRVTGIEGFCPQVLSTTPANMATDVGLNTVITVTFNTKMNPGTINEDAFDLSGPAPGARIDVISKDSIHVATSAPAAKMAASNKSETAAISGSVSYNDDTNTMTFTPAEPLIAGDQYTVIVKNTVEDPLGNAMLEDYVWTFTAAEDSPETAPTVVSSDPQDADQNVALSQIVTATFSQAMTPSSIDLTTFTLFEGSNQVDGSVTYTGLTASFEPDVNLSAGTIYTATITTGAENEAGTAIEQDFVWSFTTLDASVAPTVVSSDPQDAAEDVALDHVVTATFSQPMIPLSIDQTTFTLFDGANQVSGSVTYNGLTASFEPDNDFAAGTTFTATITTGAENEAGTAIEQDFEWSFTTQFSLTVIADNGSVDIDPVQESYNNGVDVELSASPDDGYSFDSWSGDATGNSNPLVITMDENKEIIAVFTENEPLGPGKVDLGSAGDFAILTKTGISTTGTTLITGHIGVTPASATAITGFSQTMDASAEFATSDYVVGRLYASDYAPPTPDYVSTAMSDQETAFTTAMGMTTDVINELGAGDISGSTLVPGLYKWSTGLLITNQGVTLEGGPNDTWVFQIADDFTVQNDAQITLAGGASVDNIYWITSTQALLGSNVEFKGNLLAQTLISLTNGTTVDGRLLSQTQVTLDASIVTKPE